jgi:hypothetical protein
MRLHPEKQDEDDTENEERQRTSEDQVVLPIELRHETAAPSNSAARVSSDDEPCLVNSRQSFVFLCHRRFNAVTCPDPHFYGFGWPRKRGQCGLTSGLARNNKSMAHARKT